MKRYQRDTGSNQTITYFGGNSMAAPILTAERVRELLHYDPETGIFTRKVRMAQCHQIGDRADRDTHGTTKGYKSISLFNNKYLAHRVAWLYVHGEFPLGVIDHINGIPSDNRIENLRDVRPQVNWQNQRKARSNSKSGYMGVHWHKQNRCWRARIVVDGKSVDVGSFKTPEAAHDAYVVAKRKLHEGCTI